MNIILARHAIKHPICGIGWYTQRLMQGLQTHNRINELVGIPSEGYVAPVNNKKIAFQSIVKRLIRPWPGAYRLSAIYYNFLFKKAACKLLSKKFLYHEPCYVLKPYKGPKVCTIHDLSHLYYPEYHPEERVKFLLRYLPRSVREADHIITGSHFTRNEIIHYFGLPHHKVTTVYHGVAKTFQPRYTSEVQAVLAHYGLLGKTYLLSVGTFEPRKNLKRLLLAFQQLSEQQRRQYPLVLVGAKGWGVDNLEKLIQPLVKKGQLYCFGYVSNLDLPYLYSGAYGFAYLSLYEGFGLPILEALASGVPSLIANVSSMPEVAQEAALLVDPWDVEAIADKIRQLIGDSSLRAYLQKQGPLQAAKFSWEVCVENTIDVYQDVLCATS